MILDAVLSYPISTVRFNYDAGSHMFMADASDLPKGLVRRVYDDACDEGFALKSARTGSVVVYTVSETKRDAEGDVTSWEFTPIPEHAAKMTHPARLVIFND